MEPAQQATNHDQQVTKISLKIPQFWRNEPDLWFMQLESQFSLANISSDRTKFFHLIASLDIDTMKDISDILRSQPENRSFTEIKEIIIKRTTNTIEHNIRKLLTGLQLGDRKPSQLLREMKSLIKSNQHDDIIKQIWLNAMPHQIRIILESFDKKLDELSEIADKIQPTTSIYETTSPESNKDIINLINSINDVKAEVSLIKDKLSTNNKNSFVQSRTKFSNYKNFRQPIFANKGFCWYHFTYGSNARRCQAPCSFKLNNPEN